jgi:hypothetical protein
MDGSHLGHTIRGLFLFFELQDHLFRAIVAGIEFHGFPVRLNGLMCISVLPCLPTT